MDDIRATGLRTCDADAPTLIASWEGAARGVYEVALPLSDDEWRLGTQCPGWSVGDVVAHVVGIEKELLGERDPAHEPDWAALPHAVGDVSKYTEVPIDLRRSRSKDAVLAELLAVLERRTRMLVDADARLTDTVTGPFGLQIPFERMIRMRCYDVWCHLQDIRQAVGIPGDLGTAAAWVSASQILRAQNVLLGKQLHAPAGTSLRMVVSGPVHFSRTSLVGDGGRATFVPDAALTGVPGGDGGPAAELRTDWVTYERVSAGRLFVSDPEVRERVEVRGDDALADRFLAVMAITP